MSYRDDANYSTSELAIFDSLSAEFEIVEEHLLCLDDLPYIYSS